MVIISKTSITSIRSGGRKTQSTERPTQIGVKKEITGLTAISMENTN
jgi:hypothetical protein